MTLPCLTLCALSLAAVGDDLPPPAPGRVDFARDVRPIFEAHCVTCHGPERQRGGLRLDRKEDALGGGDSGPAFEPGKSAESLLVEKVAASDPLLAMPPKGERLMPEQVGILRAWIDAGAAWPETLAEADPVASDHWAFRPPERPAVPDVSDPGWVRNPIDAFILARLDAEGLQPSPEADRATLLRRVSLDLTGLPPTPEEVDAFLADTAPDAYEKQVERLLASPHHGEHRARRWLDLARYADTNGYEKDRERSIWPYRDWVIAAFNADMPFDRFTIEQIAGDLLPGATLSQKVATGFHRNTMINEEGGIDVEEFRFAAVVDRVATTGAVWLGLTIGCAQCHTHKFDPITQREYYRFFALLNNADEPEIDVPDPAIAARREALLRQIADREAARAAAFPIPDDADPSLPEAEARRWHLDARLAAWEAGITPVRWTPIAPSRVVSRKHATMTVLDDRSVLVTGDKPNNDVYEVDLDTDLAGITAIRLEVLPHDSLPDGGPGRAPLFSVGDFLLTDLRASAGPADDPGGMVALAFSRASQDYCEEKHPAANAIDDRPDTGWNIRGATGRPHAAVFEFKDDVGGSSPSRIALTLHQDSIHQTTIGRFRLSVTTDPRPVLASGLPARVEEAMLTPAAERSACEQALIRDQFLSVAPELAEVNEEIEELRSSLPEHPTTMVMRERLPEHARTTHIHQRGEFLRPTEAVEPGVPAVLHPLPDGVNPDRLALARWLVAEDNPLVGRVTMNRLWQGFFGRGLVATPADFGTRGERPSHPELLDWLATEFVRQGWSLKALQRLIVTSATYRQDSKATPELLEADPGNVLLARGPRFRVEAETIRDIALSASGLLNPALGGPSVYPPQPEGVTSLAYGQASWPTSEGPARYRRGLYTFLKRTAPYAAFITFDAPTSETTCPRRERSDTPLQALTLLNDPVFVEAARALARRVLDEVPDGTDARIDRAFRLCTGRHPDEAERAAIAAFLEDQRARFRSGALDPEKVAGLCPDGADPAEQAAWTATARALLNLDETITKE